MRYIFFLVFLSSFFSFSCKQDIIGPHPEWYELKQNWPNPFKDTTHIVYGVPSIGNNPAPHVRVVVYDRFKNLQYTLVDQFNHYPSYDTVLWLGRDTKYEKVPAGVYYIELQTIDFENNKTVQARIAALKQ